MKEIPFVSGAVLVVDKPLNWTSFDVVKKIRYVICKQYNLKKIKVGHAGTLDPLASGLIVVCTGEKTKIIFAYLFVIILSVTVRLSLLTNIVQGVKLIHDLFNRRSIETAPFQYHISCISNCI